MTGPRRLPTGWHATAPTARAEAGGERLVLDDEPQPGPGVRLNRAQRRAAARALRKAAASTVGLPRPGAGR
ncbi:hypothetical protein ACRAR1_06980 [Streptomyces sanyensis]|uniref:hypothetical protein n=1 Tax=Streptomyces sanyensis TaxID=568869 RepID=UPI003D7780BE